MLDIDIVIRKIKFIDTKSYNDKYKSQKDSS